MRAICVGILFTTASLFFMPFQVHAWWMVVVTLLLTAVLFSLTGLFNAVFAKSFDDISIILMFCSLSVLPPFWQMVSQLNPVVYYD